MAVAVLALSLALGADAQSPSGLRVLEESTLELRPLTEDAGDGYVAAERWIGLHRSLEEVVVAFEDGVAEARQQAVIGRLEKGARLERKGAMRKRGLAVVRLPEAELQEAAPRGVGSPAARRQARRQRREAMLAALRRERDVRFAFPVLVNPETGGRLFMTDEVLVKLAPGARDDAVDVLLGRQGLERVRPLRQSPGMWILRVLEPAARNALDAAQALSASPLFETVEPNLMLEIQENATPNDPMFGSQWHLNNTGQTSSGLVDADVDAAEAWDLTTGDSGITIAIIDDAVDLAHEDLSSGIFQNAAEVSGAPGVDDDGNGYVDDVNGWDFYGGSGAGDNDPSPSNSDDDHGTSVAGVAAARGNNATGVSGACQTCEILPIRIGNVGFVSDYVEAIRYGGYMADIVSCSWSIGSPWLSITNAIAEVNANGRGGLGTPVLFASANGSSGMQYYSLGGIPAGTHRYRWQFTKNGSVSAGDDTVWIAWIYFPDGTLAHFESGGLPAGFSTGGDAGWTVVDDPVHADEGGMFIRSARAGTITDGQTTWLDGVGNNPVAGRAIQFYFWVSSEEDFDTLTLLVDLGNNGIIDVDVESWSGVPVVTTAVAYPASAPASIAVGASTDMDYRSGYSQHGPDLDFVAPSNGGPWNAGITTTDRTGAVGYDSSNYTGGFGGTSSATPLAAGVAGLMLSRNPNLTSTQVRQLLRSTADEVGPEPYVAGRNHRYGYGRINAYEAVLASTAYTLDVTRSGSGSGTVTSSPAGIDCGSTCSAEYLRGTQVALSAAPAGGSVFMGWLQPASCVGTGDCVVALTSDVTVEAEFATSSTPCVAPPGFDRLQGATQAGGGGCGVDLTWNAATPVCGAEVAYSVYRSTTAPFTPALTNRIATGLSGTTYADSSGLAAGTYHYVVRATDSSNTVDDGNASEQTVTLSGCTTTAPDDVLAFTVTANGTSNHLNWLNPVAGYDETVICWDTGGYPSTLPCTEVGTLPDTGPGNPGSFEHAGRTLGQTYYYTAFVLDPGGASSPGKESFGRPPDASYPQIQWAYTTGASVFAPAGVVADTAYYQVSNDRGVHAMQPDTSGGMWPGTWAPLSMNEPAEGRPLALTLRGGTTVLGVTRVGFVASQDGRVYAFDAETGEQLWVSEVLLGRLQGAVSGQFTGFGASFDLLVVGTRVSGVNNAVFGLNLSDGRRAWRFDGSIGMIASQVSMDAQNNRAYFTSNERSAGADTVWYVDYTESSVEYGNSVALGSIDAPPILRGGSLFVGTRDGGIHQLDPVTLATAWSYDSGSDPVTGLWVDSANNRVFFSTGGLSAQVHGVTVGAGSELWTPVAVDNASGPLLWQGNLYVGGSNSELRQIAADTGVSPATVILGGSTTTVGSPTLDVRTGLMMVGTGEGVVYAVQVPF